MKMFGIIKLVTVLALGGTIVGSFVTNYNYGNQAEKVIIAEHKDLQNILGQYTTKIREMAQVPGLQSQQLAEVFTGAIEARYGGDGSQAAFQWIQEQNPNLDQSTYKQLQQAMEAGRNKFEVRQSRLIDVKREYETNLGYLYKGFWLNVAGYPKIDLDDYDIVISTHAKESFETGIDDGITL